MPRSFALGEPFEAFIDEEVRSGRFDDPSEVVRAGLRLLKDTSTFDLRRIDELRRLVEESRKEGGAIDAEAAFDRLETRYSLKAGSKSE